MRQLALWILILAASTPLLEAEKYVPPKLLLPLRLYSDCEENISLDYVPSGYMGFVDGIDIDQCAEEYPHTGSRCIRIKYNGFGEHAGIAWQNPPNDWGDVAGGYDLTGARRVTFWARGEKGGEKVEFKMGIIRHRMYPDSTSAATGKMLLTDEWEQYEIWLKNKSLKCIKTPFAVTFVGGEAVTIYLDDIQYE